MFSSDRTNIFVANICNKFQSNPKTLKTISFIYVCIKDVHAIFRNSTFYYLENSQHYLYRNSAIFMNNTFIHFYKHPTKQKRLSILVLVYTTNNKIFFSTA